MGDGEGLGVTTGVPCCVELPGLIVFCALSPARPHQYIGSNLLQCYLSGCIPWCLQLNWVRFSSRMPVAGNSKRSVKEPQRRSFK